MPKLVPRVIQTWVVILSGSVTLLSLTGGPFQIVAASVATGAARPANNKSASQPAAQARRPACSGQTVINDFSGVRISVFIGSNLLMVWFGRITVICRCD